MKKQTNKKTKQKMENKNLQRIRTTVWQSENATIPKIFKGYNIVIFNT